MILVKRMTPMIMPLRAAAVLHRYFDITLDSRLDPIIAEHSSSPGVYLWSDPQYDDFGLFSRIYQAKSPKLTPVGHSGAQK